MVVYTYVYGLFTPKGKLFYIGKTSSPKSRFRVHLKESYNFSNDVGYLKILEKYFDLEESTIHKYLSEGVRLENKEIKKTCEWEHEIGDKLFKSSYPLKEDYLKTRYKKPKRDPNFKYYSKITRPHKALKHSYTIFSVPHQKKPICTNIYYRDLKHHTGLHPDTIVRKFKSKEIDEGRLVLFNKRTKQSFLIERNKIDHSLYC